MIPLTFANNGEKIVIKKIGGSAEVKRLLQNLGFAADEGICIVASVAGNLIIDVKGTRVAVSRELAERIMVEPVAAERQLCGSFRNVAQTASYQKITGGTR